MVILVILNVGIASTRVVLTVGANVPTTYGKDIKTTSVGLSCNVSEVKKRMYPIFFFFLSYTLSSLPEITQ